MYKYNNIQDGQGQLGNVSWPSSRHIHSVPAAISFELPFCMAATEELLFFLHTQKIKKPNKT